MLSTMLLSICTHFYQLVIVQGLCTGLAYGMMCVLHNRRLSLPLVLTF